MGKSSKTCHGSTDFFTVTSTFYKRPKKEREKERVRARARELKTVLEFFIAGE